MDVPVDFRIAGGYADIARKYGHWDAYFPGPVQSVPWDDTSGSSRGSADAITGSAPFVRDVRVVLKTQLDGDSGHS